MKIAIVGYGKMGKTIEKLALEMGHEVALIIDADNSNQLSDQNIDIDIAIEFSTPSTVISNIKACVDRQLPVVVGTTGWLKQLPEISQYIKEKNGTLFFASNFSLGVNIFFKINQWLARVMNNYPDYQVKIDETHHIHKLDKPSGTAITLADDLIDIHDLYSEWTLDSTHQKNQLLIQSNRLGEVPGDHSVVYKSSIDELKIEHKAYGREGFALGAIKVAEWTLDKKGILTMNDFIKI